MKSWFLTVVNPTTEQTTKCTLEFKVENMDKLVRLCGLSRSITVIPTIYHNQICIFTGPEVLGTFVLNEYEKLKNPTLLVAALRLLFI